VKQEATRLGLDRSHAALAAVAKEAPDEQMQALQRKAAEKAASRKQATASDRRVNAAIEHVRKLSNDELLVFRDWFVAYEEDEPPHRRT